MIKYKQEQIDAVEELIKKVNKNTIDLKVISIFPQRDIYCNEQHLVIYTGLSQTDSFYFNEIEEAIAYLNGMFLILKAAHKF